MRPHAWIGLSDDVRLGVLTEQVTPELVDEALAACGVRGWSGALSARFMVYFTLALALFHTDSYDDVAENLVGALDGMDEAIPNKSNFTRARARLGPRPLEAVFRALAGPLAPDDQVGSFWRGMRLAAIDGFVPKAETGFQVKKPNMRRSEILKEMKPGNIIELKRICEKEHACPLVLQAMTQLMSEKDIHPSVGYLRVGDRVLRVTVQKSNG